MTTFKNDSKDKDFNDQDLNELQKLAEIKRVEAETRKIIIETEQKERQFKSVWYKWRIALQVFLGALIAIPAFWFYVKDLAIPLYNKENIKLSWENEIKKIELDRAEIKYKEQIEELKKKKKEEAAAYLSQLHKIKVDYQNITSINKSLADDIKKIKEQLQLTEKERIYFENKYASVQSELEKNKKIYNDLDRRISVASEESEKRKLEYAIQLYHNVDFEDSKRLFLEIIQQSKSTDTLKFAYIYITFIELAFNNVTQADNYISKLVSLGSLSNTERLVKNVSNDIPFDFIKRFESIKKRMGYK